MNRRMIGRAAGRLDFAAARVKRGEAPAEAAAAEGVALPDLMRRLRGQARKRLDAKLDRAERRVKAGEHDLTALAKSLGLTRRQVQRRLQDKARRSPAAAELLKQTWRDGLSARIDRALALVDQGWKPLAAAVEIGVSEDALKKRLQARRAAAAEGET